MQISCIVIRFTGVDGREVDGGRSMEEREEEKSIRCSLRNFLSRGMVLFDVIM